MSRAAKSGVPKLFLEGLHKSFGSKDVLKGFDLAVAPGQSVVVIGGSGTGKSVSLKCALGLIRPDKGRVLIDGEDIFSSGKAMHRALDKIGMLFQGGALFDSLSIWENVSFKLWQVEGLARREARRRAVEALAQVRLEERVADLRPSELSGGMQKRAALARAVITNPEIIFFDEPTTGLDPITADAINDLIVERTRKLGASALTITHDMASVRKVADEVAMLHDGVVRWRGPVSALDASGDPYVDQFIHGRAEGPITS